ncbi:MAG: ABC transporter ATP-binding protein [Candidatus Limnocylindrales bacterium]
MRLDIEDLSVEYGQVGAVRGLNLSVGDGELVALVGPSGCGKTTTLGFITGFIRGRTGRVLFDGVDVTGMSPQRRGIGYVFQDYAIYPHMTVRENIRFPLDAAKMERKKANKEVDEIAGLMGVGELLARRPHQLSGGQRQRVALGRALVKKPVVLLLDEPLSNLDAHLRVEVRAEIRRLQLDLKMTTVFVTHDQAEAMASADRVAVMSGGKIVALTAPTTLYARPPSLFSAQFIGSPQINIWAIDGPDGALANELAKPLVGEGGAGLLVGVRPEHVQVGQGDLNATVMLTEPLGRDFLVHLEVGPSSIRALVPAAEGAPLKTGEGVAIRVEPSDLHLFDAETGRRVEIDAAGTRHLEASADGTSGLAS